MAYDFCSEILYARATGRFSFACCCSAVSFRFLAAGKKGKKTLPAQADSAEIPVNQLAFTFLKKRGPSARTRSGIIIRSRISVGTM